MFCSNCGHNIAQGDEFCPQCGNKIVAQGEKTAKGPTEPKVELTSEEEKYLKKWSWGAFGLTFVWLFFSKLGWFAIPYVLVGLIPMAGPLIAVGLVFYFAIKGRRKSWSTGEWKSFSEFRERQRKLDIAGKIFAVLWILSVIGILSTLVLLQLGTARAIARDTKRIVDVNQIRTAVEQYYEDNAGAYPTVIDPIHIGKYLTKVPVDPLTGQTYGYSYGPAEKPTAYVVWTELEQYATALATDADLKGGNFDGSREQCTSAPNDCIYDQGYIPQ